MRNQTFISGFSKLLAAMTVMAILIPSSHADDKTHALRFGVMAPFTGDWASYGEHIRRGTELAKLELENEGIDTELAYEDACLPADEMTALKRLTEQTKIDALAANYCIIGMAAILPTLERLHMPSFHTSVVPDALLDAGNYMLTTNVRIADESVVFTSYLFNTLKIRRVAIISIETQWGEEHARMFQKHFEKLGGTVVASTTNPLDRRDFRAELTKIRSLHPDALFLVNVGGPLAIAMRQARELGLSARFLSVDEAEEENVLRAAGLNAEGLMFATPEPTVESSAKAHFEQMFREKFSESPNMLTRHAYDSTILLGRALHECQGGRECALKRMYDLGPTLGASGQFTILPDGSTKRDFVIKEVRNGHFVKLETPPPSK